MGSVLGRRMLGCCRGGLCKRERGLDSFLNPVGVLGLSLDMIGGGRR